jgi:predicted kinase
VVLDATHISRSDRDAAHHLADEAGVAFLAVEVVASEALIRGRMDERTAAGAVSDARWAVYAAQRKRFEPPGEIASNEIMRLDSALPLRENIEAVLARLASAAE